MTKRITGGGTKATKMGELKLKGLERRTHQGRRNAPRRKSDPAEDAAQAMTEPERLLSLADEAGDLVARYYEELFDLFPETLFAFKGPDADEQHRELAVALELIVGVLQRQDKRVKALKELELNHADGAVQTDHYGAIAENLRDLIADFSSNAWTGAIDQLRNARNT